MMIPEAVGTSRMPLTGSPSAPAERRGEQGVNPRKGVTVRRYAMHGMFLTRRLFQAMLAAWLACCVPSSAALAESSKAIDFSFKTTEGKTLRLSDLSGQWVLVNFWAPWCPMCWKETPALNELDARKDFTVIGVGMDYGPDTAAALDSIPRHNMRFTAQVLGGNRRDPDAAYRQIGPVDFYPTSYLYNPKGEIVAFLPGMIKVGKILAIMGKPGPQSMVGCKEAKAIC
jgi:thiol-disulfide isomerase/thioredoxin